MLDIDTFLVHVRDVREYKRAKVVDLSLTGYHEDEIASLFDVSVFFIRKWRALYRDYGADIFCLKHQGGISFLTDDARTAILEWIRDQPTCTLDILRDHLKQTYDVVYESDKSYYNLLHDAGLSYKKAQMTYTKKDPDRVAQKKKKL